MQATKCDRCGKYVDSLDIPMIRYRKSPDAEYENHLDICPECLEEFLKFMSKEQEDGTANHI